jgi:2-hydroxycyclohexanecarboxyl-CoA dehydrogenase
MVKKALSEFGRVDILVNNAGILPAGLRSEAVIVPFIETDRKAWDSDVDVCLYGAFNCCKVVMGHMVKQKYGKIVSILSDAGRIGEPGQATYSAAKAGIAGFSKALAKEAGRYCVNVNCVSIGSTPPSDGSWDKFLADNLDKVIKAYPIGRGLGRLEVPSDVANTVVYLCSDASVFITGQVISVSGGYTMIG